MNDFVLLPMRNFISGCMGIFFWRSALPRVPVHSLPEDVSASPRAPGTWYLTMTALRAASIFFRPSLLKPCPQEVQQRHVTSNTATAVEPEAHRSVRRSAPPTIDSHPSVAFRLPGFAGCPVC